MMETDVSITKDGVVILSHDVTIDRKTNRSGKIEDWNYADLITERWTSVIRIPPTMIRSLTAPSVSNTRTAPVWRR